MSGSPICVSISPCHREFTSEIAIGLIVPLMKYTYIDGHLLAFLCAICNKSQYSFDKAIFCVCNFYITLSLCVFLSSRMQPVAIG